jgi:methylated-DNA-[protein]-cysteine S-methyltransferase
MKRKPNSNQSLYYVIFETNAGWVGALASSKGCLAISFPEKTEKLAKQALGDSVSQASCSPQHFKELIREMQAFYRGENPVFSSEIDLSGATAFEQAVWQATKSIPHGQTRSYSWVASRIGKPQAARAVGQALGRNPLPILVPCHRVLAKNGGLGGFGGGLEMKKYLLDLETKSESFRLF